MATKDNWNSSIGVILAVAGSAVGLGNFLKFPGQVAIYGGAPFMIAYVCSFFLVGVPFAMMEWSAGRSAAGKYHSVPWIFYWFFRTKSAKIMAAFSVPIPFIICSYYTYIEAWCLGYAVNFGLGNFEFNTVKDASDFFAEFVGINENGAAIGFSVKTVCVYFFAVFFINFALVYLGISRGIERFCKIAMPLLILIGIALIIRVMMLTPQETGNPNSSISEGMGFMWNPTKIVLEEKSPDGIWSETKRISENEAMALSPNLTENQRISKISIFKQLLNPAVWIAAVGQLFFSMSVGMGVIISYASYLRKRDDVVLSCATASSANAFCEVCLGGMITVPAAIAFFGVSGVLGACASLFDLGFNVLPVVFFNMPLGNLFGFLFFFLLFLAAITSSISILQPSLAFFEEILGTSRKMATLLLAALTFFLCGYSIYFSKNLMALDTLDFWVGQTLIFIVASYEILMFSWHYGSKKMLNNTNAYSQMKLPKFYSFIWKYITPCILILVFFAWLSKDVLGLWGGKLSYHITNILEKNPISIISLGLIFGFCMLFLLMIFSSKTFNEDDK